METAAKREMPLRRLFRAARVKLSAGAVIVSTLLPFLPKAVDVPLMGSCCNEWTC